MLTTTLRQMLTTTLPHSPSYSLSLTCSASEDKLAFLQFRRALSLCLSHVQWRKRCLYPLPLITRPADPVMEYSQCVPPPTDALKLANEKQAFKRANQKQAGIAHTLVSDSDLVPTVVKPPSGVNMDDVPVRSCTGEHMGT